MGLDKCVCNCASFLGVRCLICNLIELDEAANTDSVLTTSNTLLVTVYGGDNKTTRTKMTCDLFKFLLNAISVIVLVVR